MTQQTEMAVNAQTSQKNRHKVEKRSAGVAEQQVKDEECEGKSRCVLKRDRAVQVLPPLSPSGSMKGSNTISKKTLR